MSEATPIPTIPLIPLIKVVIDGKTIEVPKGTSIIEAADQMGVVIPRFCYHKKLSVAANCRMCLVDVEGSRKPTPACATPATDNMIVYTKSQKTLQYQKEVMEFLLINHPLDCPVCDQGGECELQDVALEYGRDVSDFTLGKRAVPKKDIGPLVDTDLTRCIHCTRCVRFGQEVTGVKELGMLGRGEHSEISSFLDSHIHSEMSGNIIDLCPVGALTSKPFRYQARAWEMVQKPMIAPHDCIGSHLWGHIRRGRLMRVVPRENESLNETWLSDRDRFSYEALNSPARLTHPKLKKDGLWVTVSWTEALEYIVKSFHQIAHTPSRSGVEGMDRVGALASPSSTLEEFYLLQKFMRAIGAPHVDHRLHQHDDRQLHAYGTQPGLDLDLASLQASDVILWIGSDVRTQQPILHHRLRQASLKGAKILMINPEIFERRFEATLDWTVPLDHMQLALAELLKAHADLSLTPLTDKALSLLQSVTPSSQALQIIQLLLSARSPVIIAGEGVVNHPEASHSLALLMRLKERLQAKGGILTPGANTAGAFMAKAVPQKSFSAQQMLTPETQMRGYVLLNTEPDLDSALGLLALTALQQAECVVALTAFDTPRLQNYASVMLPIHSLGETDGSFVNVFGQIQRFQAVCQLPQEARPAWKVLRVLANFFDVQGFDYEHIDQVHREILNQEIRHKSMGLFELPLALPAQHKTSKTYFTPSLYGIDMLTRHAPALQATQEARATQPSLGGQSS